MKIPTDLSAFAVALGLVVFGTTANAQVIQVSSSSGLQQAFNNVADGGTIEIAAGTYQAPSGGFTIYAPKGFVVRAASGAAVTLDGGGSTDIVRLANTTVGTGRPVTFQQVSFANGQSLQNFIGGAMTLGNTEAIFVNCTFQTNATNPSTTGGGLWIDNSTVSFQGCIFANNVSKNYGAAMSVLNSRVFVRNTRFSGNRVNLPGHIPNAPGGAMFINSSSMRIDHCSFDNNQAGYVGGAIYALGGWKDPVSTPSTDLTVSDSTFTNNLAQPDPSVTFNSPTAGGAIHVEDQTTARFYNCRFTGNIARQGGSISSYRAITEIVGSNFVSNKATGTGNSEGIGGTIICLSFDGVDATTNFGTINRRAASLSMTDSMISGTGGEGRQGSGIFVSGDLNSAYGFSGVTKDTSQPPEANRATVTLNRVALINLAATGASGTPGTGGGFMGDFITLKVDNSIFANCTASDYGGALELIEDSAATITNTTFENNNAGSLGGAIAMFGGSLNMSTSNLADNRLTGSGNGSAITTSPDAAGGGRPPVDMSGVIQNCVFSNNAGGATIFDGDSTGAGPYNRLQYNANQIFPGDTSAFISDAVGHLTVTQLNNLAPISRADGTTSLKVSVPNTVPSSAPILGAILMIPQTVLQSGAPGETPPIPSNLVFAWSGGNADLDGFPQHGFATVVPTLDDGLHTLHVSGVSFSTPPPPPAVAANIATRLPVGTDQNVLIGGFIIQGPSSKRVIIRGIGPSLNSSVSGALQDPVLELHDSSGATIANNDNWRTTQLGGVINANQVIDIAASGVAPTNDAESAIVATLDPGDYTAVIRGAGNSTGIAVVEVYDLDAIYLSTLANISTRGFIQTADNVMIGGFIFVGGVGPTNVVIRALGPSLAQAGIANPLSDPTLELHDGNGTTIDSNDDWKNSPDAATIQRLGFQLSNDAESAIYQSALPRGQYTAVVRGKNGGIGIGVVEAYIF
jgi:predicted outer membrane repeat protein